MRRKERWGIHITQTHTHIHIHTHTRTYTHSMHAPWPLPSPFSSTCGKKGKRGPIETRGMMRCTLLRTRLGLASSPALSNTARPLTGPSQVMSHPAKGAHTLSPCFSLDSPFILSRCNFRCACATERPARSCVKARASTPSCEALRDPGSRM